MRPLARVLLVPLGFSAFFAVLFAPVLLAPGGLIAPDDGRTLVLPLFLSRPSLWVPTIMSGFPSVGDPHEWLLYPPAWLARGHAWLWNPFLLSAFALGASLAYAWARAISGSRTGAVVAGLAYAGSGFYLGHVRHVSFLHAAAWLPLALLAIERLRGAAEAAEGPAGPGAAPRRGPWIAALGLALALMLAAGHPQPAAFGGALAVVYAALRLPASGRGAFAASVAGGLLLSLGLAAGAWLPLASVAQGAVRAESSFEAAMVHSLPPRELPRLLLPSLPLGFTTGFVKAGDAQETGAYVGLLTLALGAIAIAAAARGGAAPGAGAEANGTGTGAGTGAGTSAGLPAWPLAAIAVVSLLLTLGPATPLGRILYALPVLGRFRAPGRFALVTTLALAGLAALGVAALERMEPGRARRALRRAAVGLAAAVLVGLGGSLLLARDAHGSLEAAAALLEGPHLLGVLLPAALALTGALALVAWGRLLPGEGKPLPEPLRPQALPGRRALPLVLVLATDLLAFGRAQEWRAAPLTIEDLAPAPGIAALAPALERSGERLATDSGSADPAMEYPSLLARLHGVRTVSGDHPLLQRRTADLVVDPEPPPGLLRKAAIAYEDRSLDLLSARFLLAPEPWLAGALAKAQRGAPGLPHGERFVPRERMGPRMLYENRRALPRARLLPAARVLTPAEALATIRTSRLPDGTPYDPLALALLEGPLPDGFADLAAASAPPATSGPSAASLPSGASLPPATSAPRLRVQVISDVAFEVATDAPGPSLLVLSEAYDAGWKARIDGRRASVLCADHALLGVPVPAGPHLVRIDFAPGPFKMGLGLSVVSLCVALGLCLPRGRGERRRGDGVSPREKNVS